MTLSVSPSRLAPFARSRWLPALAALLLSLVVLTPAARSAGPHVDESQYLWSSHYYVGLLARGDLFSHGTDPFLAPGWNPDSYWALTQPMGTRFVYGAVLALTHAPVPASPVVDRGPDLPPADAPIPIDTILLGRAVAVAISSLAFGLVAYRWRWRGAAAALFLAIPHVRFDLSHAWAEPPLILGFALAAVTWRTRYFPFVCGLAATFKLTALLLWPLVFLKHPIGRSRFARSLGLLVPTFVWTVITPPSWQFGGPLYLGAMLVNRTREQAYMSAAYGGPAGLFFPSRYALPFEVALAAAALWLASRVLNRIHPADRLAPHVDPLPPSLRAPRPP